MKKIFTFIAFICLSFCGFAQDEDPIVITAPDTVIDKKAYTLQDQGITISVSKGSAYPAEHDYNNLGQTYFAVLAGSTMTISCDDTIKGIAINGWVKKSFSATCDHGTIDYLSDDEDDAEGEPVLTISDVDNPVVTITCPKQIRCYSVEVYFTENPDDVEWDVEAADTVAIAVTTVEALDYSADSTFSEEGAYSYWLSLAPAGGYPIVWLDMYAAVKGDLSGEYSFANLNVGDMSYVQLSADEWDYEYVYDQEFTIAKTDAGYHIEGWVLADNEVLYTFVYDGAVTVSDGTYDEEDALPTVSATSTARKRLSNGVLLIERDGKTYNVLGTQMKTTK